MTRTRTLLASGLAALACAVVPAFSGSAAPAAGQSAGAAAAEGDVADWTMMVYAVGDTSGIPEDMIKNLRQWVEVQDASNVNVVMLLDLPERDSQWYPTSELPGVAPFSTAKLLVLDQGRFNEVRDLGEVSMGRPDVLAGFIDEVADRFPAEKYGLTFLDHGLGHVGTSWDDGPPGPDYMTLPEMRAGTIMGMQAAGIERFELVNMAACLMANYETASAFAPLTTAFSASEEIMFGTPFSPAGHVAMTLGGSGDDVGRALLDGYAKGLDESAANDPEYQAVRDLSSLSVVAGDGMLPLDRALDSFAIAASAHMDEIGTQVARARADALELDFTLIDTAAGSEMIDLGDFMRHLTDVPDEVAVARDAVYAALDSAVTYQVTGRGTEQATGLNVFFPVDRRSVGSYFTDGTAPAGWAQFLEAFLAAGVDVPQDQAAAFGFVSGEASVLQADAEGIKISGQLTSGSAERVAISETQVVTRIGDRDALATVLPAYVNAGGAGAVQGVWDYSLTSLSDGRKTIPATTVYQAQSGGLVGQFGAQYVAPDGGTIDVAVRVLLSSEGDIESVAVSTDEPGGGAAGIDLQDGGRLTPYLWVRSSGSFSRELSSQSIEITSDLGVTFSRLPAGTPFEMGVVVVDVAGNWAASGVAERVR